MRSENVPEVRFPGFVNNWEHRQLSELMKFSNGINAPKESYGKGRKMISVLDILANKSLVYEDILNSVDVVPNIESNNRVENGDLVFVRSSEIRDEVGWAKAYRQEEYALFSGFSIRGKRISEFDPKFIELSLNHVHRKQIESKAGGSTRFNVSQSILNDVVISAAPIVEQNMIRDFFDKLEKTIALHQQELTTLKQTKQGFLQKMFPKEGESVPEVRFPGFDGDWEQCKLGEIGDFIRTSEDPQANPDNEFIEYSMPAFDNGRSPEIVLGRTMQSTRLKISGDVLLINKLNVRQRRIWLVKSAQDENAVASSEFMPYTSKEINLGFLEQLMLTDKTTRHLESLSSGTSNSQKRITPSDFSTYQISVPKNKKEQAQISSFFNQLDRKIALQEIELEALQQTKKAFLKKMFV